MKLFIDLFFKLVYNVEARRRVRKAAETRRRKLQRLKQQVRRLNQFYAGQLISFVAFILIIIDQTVFRTVWSRPLGTRTGGHWSKRNGMMMIG